MKEAYGPEEARAEHKACVDYHTALVNSRFTITGLYVAAMGFLASALFKQDVDWSMRAAGSILACWFTICLWILELRSRALFTNIAHRGIEIERRYWGLTEKELQSGFFSRQHKTPLKHDEEKATQAYRRANPDRPYLGWSNKPLSTKISRFISHSLGLDLLYLGGLIFWYAALCISVYKWIKNMT